jgi:hypothetical protein
VVDFRKAEETDFLGSPMRKAVLSGFEANEISLTTLVEMGNEHLVIRDGAGERRLQKWQTDSAIEHWHIMRRTLPQEAWLTY